MPPHNLKGVAVSLEGLVLQTGVFFMRRNFNADNIEEGIRGLQKTVL
jgi:hypothetical protein